MSTDPTDPDRDVHRSRQESGKPIYPIIILVVLVVVATIGIIATL